MTALPDTAADAPGGGIPAGWPPDLDSRYDVLRAG